MRIVRESPTFAVYNLFPEIKIEVHVDPLLMLRINFTLVKSQND